MSELDTSRYLYERGKKDTVNVKQKAMVSQVQIF
jgi:hypothetical protein